MKKLVILIVVLALLGGGYWYFKRASTTATPKERDVTNNTPPSRDPSNATFIFDDGSVTLSGGKNEESGEDNGLVEETRLLDFEASGDLNSDSKDDTALLLVRSGGGSGTFIYVAALLSGPVTYKGSNTIFLGDRISPKSIAINRGVITVKYLDREADEPLAAEPTIEKRAEFVYVTGELQEK